MGERCSVKPEVLKMDYSTGKHYRAPGDDLCGKPLPCPDHPPTAEQERARIVAWLRKLADGNRRMFGCDEGRELDDAAKRIKRGEHWRR